MQEGGRKKRRGRDKLGHRSGGQGVQGEGEDLVEGASVVGQLLRVIGGSDKNQLSDNILSSFQTQHDWVFFREKRKGVTEPLDKRAWTLQESIISPRTIHYTSKAASPA